MMRFMPRSSTLQGFLARVLIVAALLVQFAPSIHVITPHRHESSSCAHLEQRIHLEASSYDGKEAPCFICAHLVNRQAPAISSTVICEIRVSPAPKLPPLFNSPEPFDLQAPDNRGPPPGL